MPRVVILIHENQPEQTLQYYRIGHMARWWREWGLDVRVVRGVGERVEADLLIPQVDLTEMPTAYADFIAGYPKVVNREVRSIAKRSFSAIQVRPGDGYDGPVIVKTDRNCGGDPERYWEEGALRESAVSRVWRRLTGRRRPVRAVNERGLTPHEDYPVFESVADVPPETFEDDQLLIERFVPEMDGDLYCTRSYLFFGSRRNNRLRKGTHPIVKAGSVVSSEEVPVPEEIEGLRREYGYDFGKFDYVEREGRPILLDLNRTPGLVVGRFAAEQDRISREMALGLDPWFPDLTLPLEE